MPTTPNGTTYTQTNYTTSAGEPGIYAVGDAARNAANVPLMLFVHGNPGSNPSSGDNQFTLNNSYSTLRNWLIDNGWAFVECHGAGANWGNTASRNAYRAAYNDMEALMDIGPVAVVGRSMGGLTGAWLASQDPVIAPKCVGFICLSGTLDLTYRYSIATGTTRTNLQLAYGGDATMTQEQFNVAAAGHDPMLFDTSVWSGRNAIQQYATADGTVVPGANAIPWLAKYGTALAYSTTAVTEGGDHNSTPGNDPAQSAATIAFLQTVWTPAAPPGPVKPEDAFNVTAMYYVGAGGKLYALTPEGL